jgi:hypothetical protein
MSAQTPPGGDRCAFVEYHLEKSSCLLKSAKRQLQCLHQVRSMQRVRASTDTSMFFCGNCLQSWFSTVRIVHFLVYELSKLKCESNQVYEKEVVYSHRAIINFSLIKSIQAEVSSYSFTLHSVTPRVWTHLRY